MMLSGGRTSCRGLCSCSPGSKASYPYIGAPDRTRTELHEPLSSHCRFFTAKQPASIVRASSTEGEGEKGKKKEEKKRKQGKDPNPLSFLSDGTLILGDTVMIIATECSSERILWNEDFPILLGTVVVSWFLAAAIMGDYRGRPPTTDNLALQLFGGAPMIALVDGCITWAVSAFISLAAFAILIDQVMIDPGPLLNDVSTEDTSPQLEVSIATLLTMSSWRGIAYKIRIGGKF